MTDNIRIDITLEEQQALRALTKLTKSTENFGKTAAKASKTASTGFQTFAAYVAGNVTTKALAALASGFRSVIDEVVDFDASVREINTILPKNVKITEKQVSILSDLSKQYGTSQAQQARSYYQVISAGITDTSQAFDVLKASNRLALGGLGSTETAILAITKTLNNFGDEAGSAADIADALFTGVKLGQTRMEEFGGELPKVLAISKALGLGFNDTAAALTTLTNRSENTSIAATELRAALGSILKNQAVLSKVTDKTGQSFDLERLRIDGLSKFLKDLVKTTGNASNLQAALGGRIQSLNAVLKLSADDFESLNSNIDDFANSSGASKRAADQNAEAIGKTLDRAFQTIKVTMSDLLVETVNPMIIGFKLLGKVTKPFQTDMFESGKSAEDTSGRIATLRGEVDSLKKQIKDAKGAIFFSDFFSSNLEEKLKKAEFELGVHLATQQEITNAAALDAAAKAEAIEREKRAKALEALAIAKKEETDLLITEEALRNGAFADLAAVEEANKDKQRADALVKLKKYTDERGKLIKTLTPTEQQEASKQVKIVEKADKAKLKNRAATFAASGSLISALSELSATAGRKTFGITKALALAAIPVNTAAATMRAFAESGWVGAIAAGVMGTAQLIKVATSKPPSFETGGMVGGNVPIGSGDNVNANVRSGEVILNEAMQENLAPKVSGGGEMIQTNIFMDGAQIMSVISEKLKDGYRLPQVT